MVVDKCCWVSPLEPGTATGAKNFHGCLGNSHSTAAYLACVASGSDKVQLYCSQRDHGTASKGSCQGVQSAILVTLLFPVPLLVPQITQASTIALREK